MRTAKNAAVQAEINQLASALANFKNTYGDYPPSRVLLVENGNYAPYINSTQAVSTIDANASPHDTTVGVLAQRSLTAMRKFFPKVVFSTSGIPPQISGTSFWYDYNGNGKLDAGYVLHGHECLVFFLGGVPFQDPSSLSFGMTGFGKDPVNPFTNSLASDPNYSGNQNPMYSANRQSPSFEFVPSRLFLDPGNPTTPGIPGYYDSLGNVDPNSIVGTQLNFYVYFSSYGNGAYDPNDVNFWSEGDANNSSPIWLQFFTATSLNYRTSPAPNPYTTSTTVTANNTVTYEKAQTFQIFSSGVDGLYGVGGQSLLPGRPIPQRATRCRSIRATRTRARRPWS